eukprot:5615965-Alexandrium_andersonii.AAC.1
MCPCESGWRIEIASGCESRVERYSPCCNACSFIRELLAGSDWSCRSGAGGATAGRAQVGRPQVDHPAWTGFVDSSVRGPRDAGE